MRIVNYLLIASTLLTACAGEEKSRYRDTEQLEKPPILAPNPQAQEDKEEDTSTILKKKDQPGLGEDVSITSDSPRQLKIKRSLVNSWKALGLAIKQTQIVVSDRDHDNATYTVKFDPDSFTPEDSGILGSSISFFKNDFDEGSYVLALKEEGSETVISAAIEKTSSQDTNKDSRDNEEYDADKDKEDKKDVDIVDKKKAGLEGADLLLQLLYKTLRDDLKEE